MAEHQGVSTIEIDATPEELFAIVTDLEAYPDWISDVREVEILETDENDIPLSSRMKVDITIREVEYILDYEFEYPGRYEWSSRPGGDIKSIEGSYVFEPTDDDGTIVTYTLAIDPGFPVPGFLLKRAAKHITSQALDGLKGHAEE